MSIDLARRNLLVPCEAQEVRALCSIDSSHASTHEPVIPNDFWKVVSTIPSHSDAQLHLFRLGYVMTALSFDHKAVC